MHDVRVNHKNAREHAVATVASVQAQARADVVRQQAADSADKSDAAQLSPAQFFVDVKNMIEVQQKTIQQQGRGEKRLEHQQQLVSAGLPPLPFSNISTSAVSMGALSTPSQLAAHSPQVTESVGLPQALPVDGGQIAVPQGEERDQVHQGGEGAETNEAHGHVEHETAHHSEHLVAQDVAEGQAAVHAAFPQAAQNSFDVDSATYQLAETKINADNPTSLHKPVVTFDDNNIIYPVDRHMEAHSDVPFSDNVSGLPNVSLQPSDDVDGGKRARKQRADQIDKVLNSAGTSQPLSNQMFVSPGNSHQFDGFRFGNGRISASVSRSFSFLMKTGGLLSSREGSMEFRKGCLNGGNREMSIEMLRRDFSMELVSHARKPSRDHFESELPRDMSIDFFGNTLRSTSRDFSMEMQFPPETRTGQRGASLELGAFADDMIEGVGFSFANLHGPKDDHGKELAGLSPSGEYGNASEARLMRSKIGRSQDDLMLHMMGNQAPMPIHRRSINGSIEDFREFRHPF